MLPDLPELKAMLDATERVSTVIVIDGAPGDHTLTFGGFLFSLLGASGFIGLNLYSMVVAVIGAIVVLVAYHAIRRAV